MIINYIRLFLFGTIGFIVSFFNVQVVTTSEIVNRHIGLVTALVGIVSACFTCVYLYWQIKKIKAELKQKKT